MVEPVFQRQCRAPFLKAIEKIADERGDVAVAQSGRYFLHRDRGHADVISDILHDFRRHPAFFILRNRERSHHRRLTLVGREFREFAINFFIRLL